MLHPFASMAVLSDLKLVPMTVICSSARQSAHTLLRPSPARPSIDMARYLDWFCLLRLSTPCFQHRLPARPHRVNIRSFALDDTALDRRSFPISTIAGIVSLLHLNCDSKPRTLFQRMDRVVTGDDQIGSLNPLRAWHCSSGCPCSCSRLR